KRVERIGGAATDPVRRAVRAREVERADVDPEACRIRGAKASIACAGIDQEAHAHPVGLAENVEVSAVAFGEDHFMLARFERIAGHELRPHSHRDALDLVAEREAYDKNGGDPDPD